MGQRGDSSSRWTYYSVNTVPGPLDIVWCHFPELDIDSNAPGPKARPALVRAIYMNEDRIKAKIEVSFGTSKTKRFQRPYDLVITNAVALNEMGLPQATRFDLDNTVKLPWAKEWFRPRKGSRSIIIGSLTTAYRQQLEKLKKARKAERYEGWKNRPS